MEPIKGQLGYVWSHSKDKARIRILTSITTSNKYFAGGIEWDFFQPLTRQELAEFMRLAPDGEYASEVKQADEILEEKQQSSLPVIDWSKAPANAKAHAYTPSGFGHWFKEANLTIDGKNYYWNIPGSYVNPNISESIYRIDTNRIDWRTTLQVRPQEKEQESEPKPQTQVADDIRINANSIQEAPQQQEETRPAKPQVRNETVKHDSRGTFVICRPEFEQEKSHLDDDIADEVFDKRK